MLSLAESRSAGAAARTEWRAALNSVSSERVQERVSSGTELDTDVVPASDPEIFGTRRSNKDAGCGDVNSSDGSAARDDGGCRGGVA